MIKKSIIETLILCKDRDFKHRTVNFMNNIAFSSEKVTSETVRDAVSKLKDNPKLLNVVIEGAIFADNINSEFEGIKTLAARKEVIVLLYLTEAQFIDFSHKNHGFPNIYVYSMPFVKNAFNEAFHARSQQSDSPADQSETSRETAREGERSNSKKSLAAFEASNHVRDTIALINIIDKNREALYQVARVGQRFNGLVGSLSYFANKVGFKELRNLASIVDQIARHYHIVAGLNRISDMHYSLLLGAAKNSYKILQAMRDNLEVSAGILGDVKDLQIEFDKLTDLKKRENISQVDVDQMIDDQLGKIS